MKLALLQQKGSNISDYEATALHVLTQLEKVCRTDTDLILLPECSYPSYLIGISDSRDWEALVEPFLMRVGVLAAKYHKYVGIGVAARQNGALYNSLFLYNRDGVLLGRTDKSNLWHFDEQWFTPGDTFAVYDTEFGVIGAMVCADGRIPEVARILRLQGAQLILDCANLSASAPTPKELYNQQYNFILQTRARENGVFIAVCDKCGVEDSAVTMLGRSFVVDPTGNVLAQASPDLEEVLRCEIDLSLAHCNQLVRKPSLYGCLSTRTQELPAYKEMQECYLPVDLECFTALVRFESDTPAEYVKQAAKHIVLCEMLNAALIVLPPTDELPIEGTLRTLCPLLPPHITAVFSSVDAGIRKAIFFGRNGLVDSTPETHADAASTQPIRCVSIRPGVKVAALFNREMDIPEVPRVATLLGADLLIWFDDCENEHFMPTMQTRSAENRVFVARTTSSEKADFSRLVSPDGATICTTFCAQNHVSCGMVFTALSKSKTVVPGTNIILSRIPHAYHQLTI